MCSKAEDLLLNETHPKSFLLHFSISLATKHFCSSHYSHVKYLGLCPLDFKKAMRYIINRA